MKIIELTTIEELPAPVAEIEPTPEPEPAPVAEPPFDYAALATLKAQKQALETQLAQTLSAIAELDESASKPLSGDTDAMMIQLREIDGAISRKAEQTAIRDAINAKLAMLAPVIEQRERQRDQIEQRERQRAANVVYQAAGERYAVAFNALMDALMDVGKAAYSANRQTDFVIHCRRSAFPRLDCITSALRPGYFIREGAIAINPNHSAFQ